MAVLARVALLPSIAVIGIFWGLLYRRNDPLARLAVVGLGAGPSRPLRWRQFDCPDFGWASCPEIFPG